MIILSSNMMYFEVMRVADCRSWGFLHQKLHSTKWRTETTHHCICRRHSHSVMPFHLALWLPYWRILYSSTIAKSSTNSGQCQIRKTIYMLDYTRSTSKFQTGGTWLSSPSWWFAVSSYVRGGIQDYHGGAFLSRSSFPFCLPYQLGWSQLSQMSESVRLEDDHVDDRFECDHRVYSWVHVSRKTISKYDDQDVWIYDYVPGTTSGYSI